MVRLSAILVGLFFATMSWAQSNYQVQPGDVLQIEVLEDPGLNRSTLVLPDGRISFPFAGTVQASGRTLGQIEQALINALAPNFATRPNVYVSVANLNPTIGGIPTGELIDIYLLGEVNNPGRIGIERGTTLLQALAESGGVSRFAAKKRIQLRRRESNGQERIYSLDYQALLNGARLQRDITLHDGDVILVPERRLFE